MSMLGVAAAFGSSVTWAYSSTRYAQASRAIGTVRVNLLRALVVTPIYAAVALAGGGAHAFAGVDGRRAAWMLVSVICSYALADGLFFTAARRLGVSTAMSIASTYPLWAAAAASLVRGEPFGPLRGAGTLLCVGGVSVLVKLHVGDVSNRRGADALGVGLALVTSLLWAGNSFSIKEASVGLSVWPVNAIRYGMALAILAAQAAAARSPDKTPLGVRMLLPAILADALLGSIFYVYGLSHTDLAVGSTLSSLAPLVSVPFAVALGEERWSGPRFAATCATVCGVVVLVAS
jgi:drug/metabolite transporter (DMT)-like permease